MKHELFSELRTIYETTVENPHTFRVTVKTKDMVDEEILKRAVAKTTKRHPYFCVKLVMEGDDIFFEDANASNFALTLWFRLFFRKALYPLLAMSFLTSASTSVISLPYRHHISE